SPRGVRAPGFGRLLVRSSAVDLPRVENDGTRQRFRSGCRQRTGGEDLHRTVASPEGGAMQVVRPVEGSRLAAVVEAPRGALTVAAQHDAPVRLSLIVPTYNESRNLEELLRQLTAVLEPPRSGKYVIIVVDDDSPDRRWE